MPKILNRLLAEGRLRRHRASAREIADLLGVVDRNLADASVGAVSADRRFAIAYEAALELATITLYCNGYETYGAGHHCHDFPSPEGNDGRCRRRLRGLFRDVSG